MVLTSRQHHLDFDKYRLDVVKVRPANRDWACQKERCHTLSNKTSLQ